MPAYATQAEFEAYVEGWVTDNPDALARLLERASRDLDGLVFPAHARLASGTFAGFVFDPARLTALDAAALSRATCAQAEYRFDVGESEWAQARGGGRVKGPDFEVEVAKGADGGALRLAPKAGVELRAIRHLFAGTARARG